MNDAVAIFIMEWEMEFRLDENGDVEDLGDYWIDKKTKRRIIRRKHFYPSSDLYGLESCFQVIRKMLEKGFNVHMVPLPNNITLFEFIVDDDKKGSSVGPLHHFPDRVCAAALNALQSDWETTEMRKRK